MTPFKTLICALALLLLSGCASMFNHTGARQAGSIVDYLYPDAKEAPAMQPTVTRLRLPVRVGIAFVPGGGLPEATRTQLLERVKASFAQYDYIGKIEIIPSAYLRLRGGFANLDQVARMFDVDVVALVSYDQIRFNDTNRLAVLYWTIVGAYLVKGDQYDVQTMVDAAVFDVKSRKLLFRAPGTSQMKGSATMASYSKDVREAQSGGYTEAVDQLIPQLQAQLAAFKDRAKSDPTIQVERRPGERGGGDVGWIAALALLGASVWAVLRRARAGGDPSSACASIAPANLGPRLRGGDVGITLALVGLCLLLACAGEPVARHLAWDRGALLGGQLWRLWTGHLVHYSASHTGADALALGAAGVLVEPWLGSRRYACGLFVSAALVSIALLCMSTLDEYRGASSLATLAAALACVLAARRHPKLRAPLIAAALALGAKTVYEALGHPGLPSSLPAGVAVAWQAHALGAALGVALAYMPLKRAW